ncbi:FAD-dependent oxidoreductase [Leeuwenhoekiella sp. H156]|uniref:FAD-dependent oxidoreductase n=1 Tax=Leeuwenhoekiella sp. H156 TaxID=3450128 RepID=UPI003FA4AEF1
MKNQEHILIIGAGLCGSLLALRMAQRGYRVTLMEKRPDLRKEVIDSGRSINLAFSDRGMKGLRLAGLEEKVLPLCIPMRGRMIHSADGQLFMSPYSGRSHEYINSISREDLNVMLLDECEKMPEITMLFNQRCTGVTLETAEATFEDYHTKEIKSYQADVVMGADGVGSALRKSMLDHRKFLFSYGQDFLTHGYKELSFPPLGNGGYQVEKNALHIWPRGKDMMIALPNLDGSFTVTLFLSWEEGKDSFESLNSDAAVTDYFEREFPDALALMPDLLEEFKANPTSPLGTIKCSPWHAYGKVLLLGDAAHGIVPFYGQGMNSAFEDIFVLDRYIDKHEGDWKAIFKAYQDERKEDTDAIADLAVDNFHEMKAHTARPIFQEKRKLEIAFEEQFPKEYFSKYSLVTFREDLRYSEAMRRGRVQDKAILNLIHDGKFTDAMSLHDKLDLVKQETRKMLHDDEVVEGLEED